MTGAIKYYCKKLENNLKTKIQTIFKLLDTLIEKSENIEALAFYYKLKADNYRYICEFTDNQER